MDTMGLLRTYSPARRGALGSLYVVCVHVPRTVSRFTDHSIEKAASHERQKDLTQERLPFRQLESHIQSHRLPTSH